MRLIDADALRREIDNHWPFTKEEQSKHGIADMAKSTLLRVLNQMPTVQPERKTGKWLVQDNPGTGWYRVTCSECGEDVTANIPLIGFFPNCKPLWDFCPYCGADMRCGDTE